MNRSNRAVMVTLLALACGDAAGPPSGTSQTEPPAVYSFGLAYDEARGRLVRFGGFADGTLSGETWEWDGTRWARMSTSGPSPRNGPALSYDARRQRIVLFGGSVQANALTDTWEWDGTQWTQRASTGPEGRFLHQMSYDRRRGRTVLFGGRGANNRIFGDTWEWDGTAWTQVAEGGPAGRFLHAMAYDSVRGRTVVFGGGKAQQAPRPGDFLGDTWEWDGARWHEASREGPAPRDHTAGAYDARLGRFIVFGGGNEGGNLGDAWSWDGARWTQLTVSGVSARSGHSMAWDPAGRILVHGGFDESGVHRDVRVLSVQARASAAWPAARSAHASAYDPHRQRLVVYGGNGPLGSYVDTTGVMWEWDGARWHTLAAPGPGARDDISLVYDPVQRRTLLFGGRRGSDYFDDLWSWDGTRWTRLAEHGPESRHLTAVSFDAARGELVVHGGHIMGRNVIAGDTWLYGAGGWRRHARELTPRFAAGMAWDATRGAVILHGGHSGETELDDTWQWTGRDWERIAVGGPRGPAPGALVGDAANRRLLLLAGSPEPTSAPLTLWQLQGNEWQRVQDGPAWRGAYSVAVDAGGRVLLFGGGRTPNNKLDELWLLSERAWKQIDPET